MQYNLDLSQRWKNRRSVFVPPESRINPGEFAVEEIDRPAALRFIEQVHYLRTCPVAMTCVGLFRKTGVETSSLEGVAVFGKPGSPDSIAKHAKIDPEFGVELTRFALTDVCAFNAETWFMRRALGILRKTRPAIEVVLSHSDPFERTDVAGNIIFPGHVGQVYAASNALYCGQGQARTQYLCEDGTALPDRNFSKIRNGKGSWISAMENILKTGAPRPTDGETPRQWLDRTLKSPIYRPRRHPGVHIYLLPVEPVIRRRLERDAVRLPYPKRHGTEAAGRHIHTAA